MSLPNNPSQADIVKSIRNLENISSVSGDTFPIGAVVEWYSDLIPVNWLLCDGSAVSRADYSELFKILGTTYGEGDGSTTFNLPDRKGVGAIGKDENDSDFNTLGKKGGSKEITLTTSNMPAHTHTFTGTAHAHGLNSHTHTYAKVNTPTGKASGNTGSTTLTVNQIPSHRHTVSKKSTISTGSTNTWRAISSADTTNADFTYTNYTEYTGGGQGHTHTLNSHTHTTSTTSTNTGAASGNTADATAGGTNSTEGEGQSFNNMNPHIVANFIIKAKQSAGIIAEVEDNLNSNSAVNALSANQGRILNKKIDIKITLDTEIATNEYITVEDEEKRVYIKQLEFTDAFDSASPLTKPHNITGATRVWIDYSNSYIQATNSPNVTYTFPLVLYSSGNIDVVQPYVDLNNLYLRSQTGWNQNWKKVVRLKYIK